MADDVAEKVGSSAANSDLPFRMSEMKLIKSPLTFAGRHDEHGSERMAVSSGNYCGTTGLVRTTRPFSSASLP